MWTAILITLLGIIIDIQNVDATRCSYLNSFGYYSYYSCYSSQYCCGTRSCCYYQGYSSTSSRGVYSLWYFWFGIIFFILICSGASGAYYRKRQRVIVRTHPAPVQAAPQTMVISTTASSGMQGYPPPPPPYSQAMANQGPATGAAPYPVGYSMPPPNNYNNQQGMAVPHY